MLGATETTIGPDVAPEGMLITIPVAVHELIVTGTSFNKTMLFPCETPNPEPKIVISLPTRAVVADSEVITAAGETVELTDTLSNVAVPRVVLLPLATTKPTYTFGAMVTVSLAPNCTQFTPSADE
jgi:hypothetical protein